MTKLCFILGDQLNHQISSLKSIDKNRDCVFLCEVAKEASYVRHHPKKIAFLFSAMRHFAQALREAGYQVHYTLYDDVDNQGSFTTELCRLLSTEKISEICVTEPGEWRVLQELQHLKTQISVPITIYEDDRFLCSIHEFNQWAKGKKQLRMEFFYRQMRQKHRILMTEKNKPCGGAWNYDEKNRHNANAVKSFPSPLSFATDTITHNVLQLVDEHFNDHFGTLHPFNFAVTREQALAAANYFIQHYLHDFGDYQDAMLANEVRLFHSQLSFYLNAGLLLPLELCQMAEQAYYQQKAPLNSVEGFIRQILGWREYIRGIYWRFMPDYQENNYFNAQRDLPTFYWGEETSMSCIKEVVRQTATEAYSHHIQRLMITGNFALLTGIAPKQVCDWYLAVYADAYEWVELPNTLGMALYGDGGLMASKPYAASGKYIHRMSNFCGQCQYNPNEMLGDKACPFNALYWNFLHQNADKLQNNPRLSFAYRNWKKMNPEKKTAIIDQATELLAKLDAAKL